MPATFNRLLTPFAHDHGSPEVGLCRLGDVLPALLARYGLAEANVLIPVSVAAAVSLDDQASSIPQLAVTY
jgi:hypothetical protein